MKLWARLPRWVRVATTAVVGVALAYALFGYSRSQDWFCSVCWATTHRDERGLALSCDLRLPLVVTEQVTSLPGVPRFLPPDHVHGRDASKGFGQDGPLGCRALGCGDRVPGPFAWALALTPGFADFAAAQAEAGEVDLATVRALIAATHRDADDPECGDLVRRGSDLLADFLGVASDDVDLATGTPPRFESNRVLVRLR